MWFGLSRVTNRLPEWRQRAFDLPRAGSAFIVGVQHERGRDDLGRDGGDVDFGVAPHVLSGVGARRRATLERSELVPEFVEPSGMNCMAKTRGSSGRPFPTHPGEFDLQVGFSDLLVGWARARALRDTRRRARVGARARDAQRRSSPPPRRPGRCRAGRTHRRRLRRRRSRGHRSRLHGVLLDVPVRESAAALVVADQTMRTDKLSHQCRQIELSQSYSRWLSQFAALSSGGPSPETA